MILYVYYKITETSKMMPLRLLVKLERIGMFGRQVFRGLSNEPKVGLRAVVNEISSNATEAIEKVALEPMSIPTLDQLPGDALILEVSQPCSCNPSFPRQS